VDIIFFGESRVRCERYGNRIPRQWKLPLLWAQPFLAERFLTRVGPDRLDVACGVALALRKPAEADARAETFLGSVTRVVGRPGRHAQKCATVRAGTRCLCRLISTRSA